MEAISQAISYTAAGCLANCPLAGLIGYGVEKTLNYALQKETDDSVSTIFATTIATYLASGRTISPFAAFGVISTGSILGKICLSTIKELQEEGSIMKTAKIAKPILFGSASCYFMAYEPGFFLSPNEAVLMFHALYLGTDLSSYLYRRLVERALRDVLDPNLEIVYVEE